MDFGVGYLPTHDGIGPGALARMLEEHGHSAVFFDPAILAKMRDAGAERAVRWLLSGGRGHVERALERWEDAIARYNRQ